MKCRVVICCGLILFPTACGNESGVARRDNPSSIASAVPNEQQDDVVEPVPPVGTIHSLAGDEHRVVLVVLPGNASVEVDGHVVSRRNGLIELVGKVGDVYRIRAFKGKKSTEEKNVTILADQPSPSLIDLNEALPVKSLGKAPKKPARFGGFDD